MAQIFHRAANPLSKASLFGGVFIVAALVYVFDLLYKSPYINGEKVIQEQPVPFSHRHHVQGLGIDCRYCHTAVEQSSSAGMPSVQTCMTCHSQVWTDAPVLEPVRQAYRTGEPLKWVRVNSLPDFVYFDHSIHVAKGVACETCHGPVAEMPLTWRQASLQMRWCLSCHEAPAGHVRPREALFQTGWRPEKGEETELSRWLAKEYRLQKKMDCASCHR
jgi:hypothetical protein